ncbi:MAG: hypothetical protein U0939_17645 [Pirellulales bacterium]
MSACRSGGGSGAPRGAELANLMREQTPESIAVDRRIQTVFDGKLGTNDEE